MVQLTMATPYPTVTYGGSGTKSKRMTEQEMITEILRIETLLTQAVFKGHKASTDDEYHHLRERAKEFRKKLGII